MSGIGRWPQRLSVAPQSRSPGTGADLGGRPGVDGGDALLAISAGRPRRHRWGARQSGRRPTVRRGGGTAPIRHRFHLVSWSVGLSSAAIRTLDQLPRGPCRRSSTSSTGRWPTIPTGSASRCAMASPAPTAPTVVATGLLYEINEAAHADRDPGRRPRRRVPPAQNERTYPDD